MLPTLASRPGRGPQTTPSPFIDRLRRWLGPVFAASLFGAALWAIHRELGPYHHGQIVEALQQIPASRTLLALLLTVTSYLLLTLLDQVTLRAIHVTLPYRRASFASLVAYAFSHSVGFAAVTGAAIRYRLYSAWGLSASKIAQFLVLGTTAFWLGFALVGGVWFVKDASDVSESSLLRTPRATFCLGLLLLSLLSIYLVVCLRRRRFRVLPWRDYDLPLPSPSLAILQTGISALDWIASAAVLWVLLDQPEMSLWRFLGVFLLAQVAGVISQIPGGLGVFESLVLTLTGDAHPTPAIAAALISYRLLYYVLPLVTAAALFSARETFARWPRVERVSRAMGRWASGVIPTLLTVTTFAAGIVLLVSGATPAESWRLKWLRDVVPLPVIELSHFLGSLTGAGLLLLARGLQQRLDAAYTLTALLLAAGAGFSLAKGVDYEEALFLVGMLALLLPCRRHFYRRASLFAEPFTPGWLVAVAAVIAATAWISVFAHKHVELAGDLWWTFAFRGDASRTLRALTGVVALVAVIGTARLLRPAPARPQLLTSDQKPRLLQALANCSDTSANLALLGDKAVLFSPTGNSFVMYAVEGRSFVALGDPSGLQSEIADLAWRFRELADRHGGYTVFYEVSASRLPMYLDMGLALVKLGEEARVALDEFSIQGNSGKSFRSAINSMTKDGCSFEIVATADVPALLPTLRAISDAWLASKNTREKGFSLGYFDEEYLANFPMAVVRQHGRPIAFANIWAASDGGELSVDLMRFAEDAPKATMDFLFLQTMLWGKERHYRWFNLGMAPLSGLEAHRLGPLWGRVASFVFRHGEHFYNFQGLRQYKQKFSPDWQPRYLAFPGRLTFARVLLNVASLTSGGLRGVVTK